MAIPQPLISACSWVDKLFPCQEGAWVYAFTTELPWNLFHHNKRKYHHEVSKARSVPSKIILLFERSANGTLQALSRLPGVRFQMLD